MADGAVQDMSQAMASKNQAWCVTCPKTPSLELALHTLQDFLEF